MSVAYKHSWQSILSSFGKFSVWTDPCAAIIGLLMVICYKKYEIKIHFVYRGAWMQEALTRDSNWLHPVCSNDFVSATLSTSFQTLRYQNRTVISGRWASGRAIGLDVTFSHGALTQLTSLGSAPAHKSTDCLTESAAEFGTSQSATYDLTLCSQTGLLSSGLGGATMVTLWCMWDV